MQLANIRNIQFKWTSLKEDDWIKLVLFKFLFRSEGNMDVLSCSINTLKGLYNISYVQFFSPIIFLKISQNLSLNFWLFKNILVNKLVVVIFVYLVPLVTPIPVIFLGLFTSGFQAFIFAILPVAYIDESMKGHHWLVFIFFFSLDQIL